MLPVPRLRFDLAAYWVIPAAKAMISDDDVARLLATGAVLLPSAFPIDLAKQVILHLTIESHGHLSISPLTNLTLLWLYLLS